VLDLAVYGPLGLALSIAEAMPAMARKGRNRLVPQFGLARTVGQLAVQQGYRQLRGVAGSGPVIPFLSRGPMGAGRAVRRDHGPDDHGPDDHGPDDQVAEASGAHVRAYSAAPASPAQGASRATTARPAGSDAPGTRELAIPSYDSLSASQVVQRLAGLSYDEVAAVQAYESATRGRRTILNRAEQLLG
jgi:hypothetical protein